MTEDQYNKATELKQTVAYYDSVERRIRNMVQNPDKVDILFCPTITVNSQPFSTIIVPTGWLRSFSDVILPFVEHKREEIKQQIKNL